MVSGVIYTQTDFGSNIKGLFSFTDKEDRKGPPTEELNQVVNKYLKQASIENLRQEVIAEKTLAETRRQLKELEEERRRKELKEIENIPLERQVWKSDVSDGDKFIPKPAQSGSEELSPEEYARQFKENARRAGYEIELSSDMQVINYRRIGESTQTISGPSISSSSTSSEEETVPEEPPRPAPPKNKKPPPRKAPTSKVANRDTGERTDRAEGYDADRADLAERDADRYGDEPPPNPREGDSEERPKKESNSSAESSLTTD